MPMDETLVSAAVDFGGRAAFVYRADGLKGKWIGTFDGELAREFFGGFVAPRCATCTSRCATARTRTTWSRRCSRRSRARRRAAVAPRSARDRRAVDQGHAHRRERAARRVAVADTGSGNLRSVEKALAAAGARRRRQRPTPTPWRAPTRWSCPDRARSAAASRAGPRRRRAARRRCAARSPRASRTSGICLGLQVLFERSEEDPEAAAAWASSRAACGGFARAPGLKIPHMGWNAHAPRAGRGTPVLGRHPRRRLLLLRAQLLPRSRRAPRTWRWQPSTACRSARRSRATTSSPASSTPRRARPPGWRCCAASSPRDLEFAAQPMLVFPAIDLLGGKAVRLEQGRRESAKVYDQRALGGRGALRGRGRPRLHVVDLDAAFARGSGRASDNNHATIKRIVAAASIQVEVGGGVRTLDDCAALFDAGRRLRRARHRGGEGPGDGRGGVRALAAADRRRGRRARGQGLRRGLDRGRPRADAVEIGRRVAARRRGARALHRHRARRHAQRARTWRRRRGWRARWLPAR